MLAARSARLAIPKYLTIADNRWLLAAYIFCAAMVFLLSHNVRSG